MNTDTLWIDRSTVKNHISWKRYSNTMQNGKFRTNRGSWFISEFFVKLASFNTHDTFKDGNWSFQIFLKLVHLNTHESLKGNWSFRSPSQQSCQVKVWKGKYGKTCILLKHQRSCWRNEPKPKNERHKQVRSDPYYSEILEWLQEFR